MQVTADGLRAAVPAHHDRRDRSVGSAGGVSEGESERVIENLRRPLSGDGIGYPCGAAQSLPPDVARSGLGSRPAGVAACFRRDDTQSGPALGTTAVQAEPVPGPNGTAAGNGVVGQVWFEYAWLTASGPSNVRSGNALSWSSTASSAPEERACSTSSSRVAG